MSRFNSIVSHFSTGEMSKRAQGRVDVQEYFSGADLQRNFLTLPNGGVTKRPGTNFVYELSQIFEAFNPNTSEELPGPGYLKFVINEKEAASVFLRYDNFIPPFTDYFLNITVIGNDGALWVQQLPTTNVTETISQPLDPAGFVYAQSGQFLFVTHTSGLMRPQVIKFFPDIKFFEMIDYTFGELEIPFSQVYDDDVNLLSEGTTFKIFRVPMTTLNRNGSVQLRPSVTTGAGNMTASDSVGTPINFFVPEDVNSIVRIQQSGVEGGARITSYNSPSSVNIQVDLNFNNTNRSALWRISSWSKNRGYPKSVTLFEQRIIWGGNDTFPNTLWGSRVGNEFLIGPKLNQDATTDTSGANYFGPIAETDPFEFKLASSNENPITYLSSNRNLVVGTLGAEYIGGGNDRILSNLSVNFRKQTSYGSTFTKVANINNEVIYIERDGKRLRNFKFNEENGSYISINLSLLNDTIYKHGVLDTVSNIFFEDDKIIDIIHQKSKDIIWLLTANRKLISLTYSRENGTISWGRHEFDRVRNIWGFATIPNEQGTNDDLHLIMERDLPGNTSVITDRTFVLEKMNDFFDGENLADRDTPESGPDYDNGYNYLDLCYNFDLAVDSSTVTIPLLESQTGYTALIDGKTQVEGDFDGSGVFQLGDTYTAGTNIKIGLKYTARLDTVPLEAGGALGTSQGNIKRISEASARVYKTFDLKAGPVDGTGLDEEFYEVMPLDKLGNDDIFSGTTQIPLTQSPDLDRQVTFISENPFPCTILYAVFEGTSHDR